MKTADNNSSATTAGFFLRVGIVIIVFALFSTWNGLAFRGVTLLNASSDAQNLVQEAKFSYMLVLALGSLLVACFRKSLLLPKRNVLVLLAAAFLVSAGTAACAIDTSLTFNPMPTIDFGLAIAGFGIALSVPFFGRMFYDVGTKATTISVLLSYLLSAFLTNVIWNLSVPIRFAVISAIPFLQSGLIYLYIRKLTKTQEIAEARSSASPMAPLPKKLLGMVLLSGFLGSFVRGAMYFSGSEYSTSPSEALAIRLFVLTALVIILQLANKTYDTYSIFWPWATLFMVAFCVALPFVSDAFPVAIVAFFSISHNYLNAFNYTLFVDIAARYKKDVAEIFCWGRAFDALGCVFGLLLGFVLSAVFPTSSNLWYMLSMASSFAIIAIAVLILNSKDFTDFLPEQETEIEPEDSEPVDTHDQYVERYALTEREADVLVLLSQGRSIPYISKELLISTGTVKTHVASIYKKLGVHTRQELLDEILPE